MDIEAHTALTVGASAYLAQKLFGPTLDYLGEGIKAFAEERGRNFDRICRNALAKLGGRIDEAGGVPPRVLKEIVETGSFFDHSLSAEYFGGILAASRSKNRWDDRGATLAQLVSRLSLYQIRSHYLFYRVLRNVLPANLQLQYAQDRLRARTFIPLQVYCASLESTPDENLAIILPHILDGLDREGLIAPWHAWGFEKVDTIERHSKGEICEPGILFEPSVHGIELFLWAHGRRDISSADFLSPGVSLEFECDVAIPGGSRCIASKSDATESGAEY